MNGNLPMKIFVTGGAGFIGSVVVEELVKSGHQVVVIDSLKYGHAKAVHPEAKFVQGDIRDRSLVNSIFADAEFDAVLHLAAEAYIDVSVTDPSLFFDVNVSGGLVLLDAMAEHKVNKLVFSSTAAVFGEPVTPVVSEDHPKNPVNAYGETKLQFERALPWYHGAYGIHHISLRYFNACGATERCGEARSKETHIIPLLFDVVTGKRPKFTLFGDDYPTFDGTCVRDYVHVYDIAQAHLLALANIDMLGQRDYNLGSGAGFSNLQVVNAVSKVVGKEIPYEIGPRRTGDPAQLVASNDRATKELGWKPKYTELAEMIETSWNWRRHNPGGYSK